MSKKLAIFLENEFQDLETLGTTDILRVGNIIVDMISVTNTLEIKGIHGITVLADKKISEIEIENYDGIIIPGGNNAVSRLLENTTLTKWIKEFNENNKLVAAICAGPQVLGKAGIVNNKKITGYSGCELFLDNSILIKKDTPFTITDDNIVTANGPSATILFAHEIYKNLMGEEESYNFKRQCKLI